MGSWVDEETAACGLGDARLNRRLGVMLTAMGERPGKSLPTAFHDWANTKAAYRFFSNEKVSEDRILAGHCQASALRVQAFDGPILVLQDTTEFSFTRAANSQEVRGSPRPPPDARRRTGGIGSTPFAACSCTQASRSRPKDFRSASPR